MLQVLVHPSVDMLMITFTVDCRTTTDTQVVQLE